ncbi:hypothetical protein JKP88DRAFT_289576 [Tribonema minus]|uniref:Uncharacterized protein n=1 Tax=Tribonema minus TaxID=303371 RepID=A0A835Z297_9STRA|nr:hypothetical protein JKP88DRAFT_289576 [Tribonema minus]
MDMTKEGRLAELLRCLEAEGVAMRDDSSLCRCFIEGTLATPLTAEEVAHTCALHVWLYNYCDYEERCERTLPAMAASLAPSLGSWAAAWSYVKAHEAPAVKTASIRAAGGVPDIWPWLREDSPVDTERHEDRDEW